MSIEKIQHWIKIILDSKKKIIITLTIFLILGCDLGFIVVDQLFGEEKGVLFGIKIPVLILIADLVIIVTVLLGYILVAIIRSFKKILSTYSKFIQELTVSLVSVILLLFIIELVFYSILKYKNQYKIKTIEVEDKKFLTDDSILGYVARKNQKTACRKMVYDPSLKDTISVFNVSYTIDSSGFRVMNIPAMQKRHNYAAFFGCSLTFGLGVDDDQTIPYYFAQADTSFCSYNFALSGYGPQNTLALLQNNDLKKIIWQDSGVGIYIYMADHVARAIGDMRSYNMWVRNFPYYDYKDGRLFHYGNFSHDRKFVSTAYSLMGKSNFIEFFEINLPFVTKPSHYRLTCDIIYESYLEYKKTFHNDNFYVIIYPSGPNISNTGIIEYLKTYSIKMLDLSNLFNPEDARYYISKYDHHPTPLANKILAEYLAKELKEFANR